MRIPVPFRFAFAVVMLLAPCAAAQPEGETAAQPSPCELVNTGADFLVTVEEGAGKKGPGGEWPYEGVYRVRGQIPIGYRVGGTGIACLAMAMSPEYVESKPQQDAVARGVAFIIESVKHPLMNPDYDGGYDVRGWGYTYGSLLLLQLEARDLLPEDQAEAARKAAAFYVDAIQQTTIPKVGGWNYARARGKDTVSPPSPFMTSSTLQTLFLAQSLGYEVDPEVIERALDTLEAARKPSGEFVYAGDASKRRPGGVPGAVGRMMMAETTLYLAGRSTPAQVRGALDAFIVHWDWLEKRRQQTGTHIPPYGVAPYYFYYAHLAAAQAIQCLPTNERAEYRKRLIELLMRTREPDGTWNDRVFKRSANYGTAMAILALRTPAIGLVPKWRPPAEPDEEIQP
jgi:hypothetical protein